MAERHEARPAFETSDVPPKWVLWIALGLGAGAGVIALLLLGYARLLDAVVEEPAPGPLARIERVPPAPRLQAEPALELEELQAREALILESYGWVDRDAGVARIPIERAMAILAERGWPNPVEGPPAVAAPPAGGGATR
ncbi:MAG TPA: hypothetical protein VFZ01_05485 [Geminicoccaceae bacterium]